MQIRGQSARQLVHAVILNNSRSHGPLASESWSLVSVSVPRRQRSAAARPGPKCVRTPTSTCRKGGQVFAALTWSVDPVRAVIGGQRTPCALPSTGYPLRRLIPGHPFEQIVETVDEVLV